MFIKEIVSGFVSVVECPVVEDDTEVGRLVVFDDRRQNVQVTGHLTDVSGVRLDQVFFQEMRNLEN